AGKWYWPPAAGARERRPPARARPEPPLVEPREHRDDEASGIAAGSGALVARHAHEIGEPRMHRLRVEAVAVTARDGGHARAEAADDDRRWGLRLQKTGMPRPELPHELDRLRHPARARLVPPRRPSPGLLL